MQINSTESEGSNDSQVQIDELFPPVLRPRLSSLENRPHRSRLSLPVERMRAASMERVDQIGRESPSSPSLSGGGILRKPRAAEQDKKKADRTMSDQTPGRFAVPAIRLHPPDDASAKRRLFRSYATMVFDPRDSKRRLRRGLLPTNASRPHPT